MAARRHFTFIVHGARAETDTVRELIDRVRDRGHAVEPLVTLTPGDAERYARDAASRGTDAVVALGGDGTVNEVINGLDGLSTPLGIVPLGTANDFARQAGIPLDPLHAMDVILRRKPVLVDTAELNRRRFLNVSTGGFGAEATAETGLEAKESLGPLAYAITGVRKLVELRPRRAAFEGPGFSLACDFVVFAVGNGRVAGGGAVLTPAARLTDGLLDLCVIEAMPRGELARLALRVRRGEHVGAPGVHYAQLPALTIRSPQEISVNVDGEPAGAGRLSYRARPSDLLVHVVGLPGEAEAPGG